MRENGLKARQPRRFRRTTDSGHAFPVAPNHLDQDFTAAGPDRRWGADIAYIWTREGWLYLAVVLDLHSRRIVGWAAGDRLHKERALTALRRALVVRRPGPDLLHHSDRGSQYCSNEYQAELRKHRLVISMSGRGNCYDNAMVETFFKTLKRELVWRTAFQTRAEAIDALARHVDGFYNPCRRHSALGFTSPTQFERGIAHQTALHQTEASPRGWCPDGGSRSDGKRSASVLRPPGLDDRQEARSEVEGDLGRQLERQPAKPRMADEDDVFSADAFGRDDDLRPCNSPGRPVAMRRGDRR